MFAAIGCGVSGAITSSCPGHQVWILGSNSVAIDIGASAGSAVQFNVQSGYTVRGVVSGIQSSCGGLAGSTVIVDIELYGTDLNPYDWVPVGQVSDTHISPSVSLGNVLSAGATVGTVGNYSNNANGSGHGHPSNWVCYGSAHPCWTGAHVHQEWKSYYYSVSCSNSCPWPGQI